MSDGGEGPSLDLRELFEQFVHETNSQLCALELVMWRACTCRAAI